MRGVLVARTPPSSHSEPATPDSNPAPDTAQKKQTITNTAVASRVKGMLRRVAKAGVGEKLVPPTTGTFAPSPWYSECA